jgi:tight adherence protein C
MNILLIAICVGAALFTLTTLTVLVLAGNPETTQARLAEVSSLRGPEKKFGIRDMFSLVSRPLNPVRGMVGMRGDEDLGFRLRLAGYREPEAVDIFLNIKLLCPVLGILAATFTGGSNLILCSIIFGAGGFFAPDLYLLNAISKRKQAIALSLPNALDLIVICVEAGLGIDQSVLRVATDLEAANPELSDELKMLSREQRAGKPRLDAWRAMADRIGLDAIRQFVSVLSQSERLGTPIAQTLTQFADTLRAKRLTLAEEKAAKTTIKLIPPMVVFIMPAAFVVILGPAGIALADAFR